MLLPSVLAVTKENQLLHNISTLVLKREALKEEKCCWKSTDSRIVLREFIGVEFSAENDILRAELEEILQRIVDNSNQLY